MIGGNKRVHAFPKGTNPKVNVIARLEFDLAYFKALDKQLHQGNFSNRHSFLSQVENFQYSLVYRDKENDTEKWTWLIDFNGISIRQGLFYTQKLENCVGG